MQRSLVRPSIPLGNGYTKLSPLDQYMVRVILPMMCIFQLDSTANRPAILQSLHAGLVHTIDEINILAAYVVPENAEQDSIQLEYEQDAGVLFYEKDLPEVHFSDLAARRFPFSEMNASRFCPKPLGHTRRSPVMTIQATFITGGIVLAFNGHHSVLDAQALGTFAETWARHVCAESGGLLVRASERLSPDVFNGSSLFGGCSDKQLSDFQTYWPVPSCSFQKVQRHILETAVLGDREQQKPLIELSHWILSPQAMDQLKQAAQPPSDGNPIMTENSIISALVWRHITRARHRAGIDVVSSSLLSSVNVRRRIDPPLPLEYVGNAIVLARAQSSVAKLISDKEGLLYGLAHQIADSVEWWTPDRIWELAGAIDASKNVFNAMHPETGCDVLVTSPSRLGDVLGQASWGADLGPIQALRFSFPAFMDGFVVVLPSIHEGQEIMIWTNPNVTRLLEEDSEWLQWVAANT